MMSLNLDPKFQDDILVSIYFPLNQNETISIIVCYLQNNI